ncbi:MAG: hypothetical protein AB7E79_00130 [Rhodospirillaceae bacterium]
MATQSQALREDLFRLELEQIHRNARMRNGVVWAFIFISFLRGAYEVVTHEGMEGLPVGILRSVVPAVLLALMGFPLVRYVARKAEEKLRARFSEQPRRHPLS